ncbi:MAG: T9SS type A sorting domain-containing protein [Bacteroidetes bacterium]|nr:MAG: T9SS type A sorting domain-containing protein [Bacteroidota bacterium]
MKIKSLHSIGLLMVLSLFFSLKPYAQELTWAKGQGGSSNDYGRAIFHDGSGGVYIVGSFSGTVDFDPGPGVFNLTATGTTDGYLLKLNSSGTFLFAKRFGGTGDVVAYDVAVEPGGLIYITGSFTGTVDFDPGAGVANLTSAGMRDVFLVRLTTAGNWSYSQRFGSTGEDIGYSVAVNSGAYAIGGTFQGTVDFDYSAGTTNLTAPVGLTAGFITRYTSGVAFTFAAQFGNSSAVNGLAMDASGNVYSTGFINGGGDFDPEAGVVNLTTVGGGIDLFVSKLSATGAYVWAKLQGGTSSEAGVAIEVDAASNVYTTGYFAGTADFDPGAGVVNLVSGGSNDTYVCKMDVNGDYVWAVSFSGIGDDRGVALDTDVDGNVYTVGYFRNTVDFDPGVGNQNITVSGQLDGFVSKLDASGQYIWAHQIGSTTDDAVFGVSVDVSGNIHFTGFFSGTTDFDPTAGTSTLTSVAFADIMEVKWAPCAVPVAPSNITDPSNMTICYGSSTVLSCSGTYSLSWYDAAIGGNYLGSGATFNTSALTATTSYFAQDSSCIAGPRTEFIVNVIPAIADQTLSLTNSSFCAGGSTTVELSSSEAGVSYYLRNDADNSIVGTPVAGTGSAISLPTGAISTTTTFNVNAVSTAPNYALDLDGTNDYLNLGAGNRGVTATVTVSAKIKAVVTGANQFIAYKYDGSTKGYLLFLDAAGKARFDGRDGSGGYKSSGISTTLVADGQWHEVTGVVRSTGWEIYVDGVLENSTAYALGSGGLTTATNLLIGTNGTAYSSMDIDRISVWNTSLSGAAILAFAPNCLIGNETNLTGYFPLNEGAGTTATDLSSTAINGTLTNMTVPSCWISGPDITCGVTCEQEMGNLVTVTIVAAPSTPSISASGSTALCSGNSVTLTSSPGTTYLWSTGETTSSILVSSAGSYTVQVANGSGCLSDASSPTIVTVGTPPSQPSISAGGTTTFCEGGSVTLTSSAGTSYLWSNGETTPSINVTTSGTYTVQVTNSSGCQSTASVGTTVTVNALPAAPSISVGGPTTFCDGGSVTLTSSAGTTYLWSNGATTASISPTTSGTYSVQVTNVAGCQSSASAGTTVTVNALPSQPSISAGGPTTFCDGGSVTLTSTPGTSYLWSTGATTASISPTTSGNYTVQVTNASGCQSIASTATVVTVNSLPAQPTISAGGATTFCDGGSVTLTSSAGTSYLWSNGATTASISPTTSGTYSVQVTNAAGCQSTASAGTTVTVNALPAQPTITAGGPTTFCQGGSVTLTSSAGSSYLWSDGSMSSSINPNSTGTYTVQVTNAAGCQSVASNPITVTVNALPNAPIISPNAATTFCAGGTVNLASSAGITYLWSNGSTAASIDVTTSGTFTVQITGPNGCQSPASAPTTVTVNPLPTISTGTVTNPTSCTVGNGSIGVNGTGTGTLSWSGAASGSMTGTSLPATISNLNNGTYQISFTDGNGCASNTLSTTLSAPSAPAAPSITAGGATTFCEGGAVTLTSSAGNAYAWSTGETTASITVNASGNYTVSITDASGCSSPASAAFAVTVNPLPVINVGTLTNPSTCTTTDGSIEVNGIGTGSITWLGAASGTDAVTAFPYVISSLGDGSYSIEFTDGNSCTSQAISASLTLPSSPAAPTITPSGSTVFCDGDEVTLTSSTGDTYLWSNGETTQSITVSSSGTFSVMITDASGCSSPNSASTSVTANPIPVATATLSGIDLTALSSTGTYQWVDCDNGYQAVAGATLQSYTPVVNGNYAVIITETGCADTSDCLLVTGVGIDEIADQFFVKVFPNPSFGSVHIESSEEIIAVRILTTKGEELMTTTETNIDLSFASPGVYFIEIQLSNSIHTERLVRQ